MMGERQAEVCGALIQRARRDAIGWQQEHERDTAYLLMWTLGLPLGIILASAAGTGR